MKSYRGENFFTPITSHRANILRQEATAYLSFDLNTRQLCDLELLLSRAFYPLNGYAGQQDYESILDSMRLANGTVWPIPITLDVQEELARKLYPGQQLALNDREGFLLAVLTVTETWKPDKRREAIMVYGTSDPASHPGVLTLFEQTNDWYVAGTLEGLHLPLHYDFGELRLSPTETQRRFFLNGWQQVVGWHVSDYPHRAEQEMAIVAAHAAGAAIFMQPAIGPGHLEDMGYYTHIRCYQALLRQFPPNMAELAILPLAPRHAGPRAALWHAIIRRNYGCSHFMVADDHGDPFSLQTTTEKFYPLHAAQELVQQFESETGIGMVPLKPMVYVEEKSRHIQVDAVDAGMTTKVITPAELRRRLEHNLEIPEWFSFPEVIAEMRRAFPPRNQQGFTIFFSGLSGSGKSTLARLLFTKFMEMRDRPVTLLDGDIVRKNLSSELSFSREHRNLNIIRIGFVAGEITKNGGIAICAPIAPYADSRRINRELISKYGGYIEVYMSTPLKVCEQRDRKGLYAKARVGKIKGVTGISDPYEPPQHPELTIDTSTMTPTEAAHKVLLYLAGQGYLR